MRKRQQIPRIKFDYLFSQAFGPFADFAVSVEHEALVSSVKFDKWTINHCLNCDSDCFATSGDGSLLVNGNLAVSFTEKNFSLN